MHAYVFFLLTSAAFKSSGFLLYSDFILDIWYTRKHTDEHSYL